MFGWLRVGQMNWGMSSSQAKFMARHGPAEPREGLAWLEEDGAGARVGVAHDEPAIGEPLNDASEVGHVFFVDVLRACDAVDDASAIGVGLESADAPETGVG